jgi:ribosomal protein L37AE/L43A
MSVWTTAQLDAIRELGHKGVGAVHDAILERYGVEHTHRAIEVQASRIHASLKVLTECPECHALGVRINRQSGMCRRCTEAAHVAEEEAFNQLLEAEAAGCDGGPEYDELHRRWAQLRQKNSRLMRKHGLKGKRERL